MRVRVSTRARRELLDLGIFFLERNPAAGRRVLGDIDRAFRLLAEQPKAGKARPEFGPSIRSLPVLNHLVFYEEVPNGIVILRVLDARMDIDAKFRS
jgi:toxin ParE1/3/4